MIGPLLPPAADAANLQSFRARPKTGSLRRQNTSVWQIGQIQLGISAFSRLGRRSRTVEQEQPGGTAKFEEQPKPAAQGEDLIATGPEAPELTGRSAPALHNWETECRIRPPWRR